MEPRVAITELGLPPHVLEAAGYEVAPDWRGEPSISVDDAARFDGEQRRVTEAHERAWAEHLAETRAWQDARGRAAYEAAAGVDISNAGFAAEYGARRDAGNAAAAEFERSTPRPIFGPAGKASVPLEFVDESEVRGRVLAALRGRVS
jgi:hypothetical protein